jgi:hypothetical protein
MRACNAACRILATVGGQFDAYGLRQRGGKGGQYQAAEQVEEQADAEVVAQGVVVDAALEDSLDRRGEPLGLLAGLLPGQRDALADQDHITVADGEDGAAVAGAPRAPGRGRAPRR